MTDTPHETKALLAACQTLFNCAVEISRSADSSEHWQAQVSSARRCVDLALLSLQGNEVAALTAAPNSRTSMAVNVADHLLRSLAERGETARPGEPARQSLDPGEGPMFTGSTDAIALPELLSFLHGQRKTGVLQVSLETESLSLDFADGELVCACSDNSPVGFRLGEILVDQGAIDEERLESFLINHSECFGKLGAALVTEELVTEEHLRMALELQVQQVFHRLFSSDRSNFQFQPREIGQLDGELRLNVGVPGLWMGATLPDARP